MNNFANFSTLVIESEPKKVKVHALFEIRGYDDEQVATYFVTNHMMIGTCWDDEVPQLLEELREKAEQEFKGYFAILLWKWVTTA